MTTNEELEGRLDVHFMGIVNMWRTGMTDQQLEMLSDLTQLPEWLILRVGRDLHALTPAQQKRYDDAVAQLGQEAT